jgi:Domain of unknown function (DUF5010)
MRACIAVVVVLALAAAACGSKTSATPGTTPHGPPPPASVVEQLLSGAVPPMVLTYFFYWYDASTGQHLQKSDGLPIHLPPTPAPSWKSVPWFERQLTDMTDARIDVALPDFWGTSKAQAWSTAGLPRLVAARDALVKQGKTVPTIGMFYDTSILNGLDLTTASGINTFYANIAAFFHLIPKRDWALVDGRPIVWLFLPQNNKFDQSVFNATYTRFQHDFGVRPYIVRATGWNCATTKPNCGEPIKTDASFVWGTAQDGVQITRYVASAGPGYDDRLVPGRTGTYVSRQGGAYYRKNLTAAVKSGRPLVAIETWNEIHEASAIAQTVEYGRQYINITRSIVDAARKGTG